MNQRFQYLKNGVDVAEISLFNMPNATFYAFIPVENEQRIFSSLLEKHKVAVCPGSAFGSQGLNSIRLSLAGPKDDVLAGIDRVLIGLTEE
jgi:aspartate/methionine/tyrosine aminotransferase